MSVKVDITKKGNSVFYRGEKMEPWQAYPMGCGAIELRQTKKAGLHVVRASGSGDFKYMLPLRKDGSYRLGASYGHYVKTAQQEKDPIKRVLRECQVPISTLWVADTDTISDMVWRRHHDIRRYSSGKNTYHRHDGDMKEECISSYQPDNQFCCSDDVYEGEIVNATFIIQYAEVKNDFGHTYWVVERIQVSHLVELDAFKEALTEVTSSWDAVHSNTWE